MKSRNIYFLLGVLCVFVAAQAASNQKSRSGKRLASYDVRVQQPLLKMTLQEKVGQMTQPDQQYLLDEKDIETYFLGSLLSGGGSDPKSGNSFVSWREMVERYNACALKTRLAIPLIYGADAVHGHSNVEGAVIFPHNIGLGCARNPALVEKAARITATEVRATGIQWTFAPCAAVPRDIRWGRTYEGFSEDPQLVKILAAAAVRGFQGVDMSGPLNVLACAKHFVGDGGTTWGTGAARGKEKRYGLDQGDTRIDETTLRQVHLPGYVGAVQAGVASIMPSYSSWNGVKCSASEHLLTKLLKEELGFEGFLISDYGALDQITSDYRSAVRISINAGMDMVMVPRDYRKFISTLISLVEDGAVPMSRIDDAVKRILRVKFALGLYDRPPQADRSLEKAFGSEGHREVARECVRQSLVLLKNAGKALPIPKAIGRIHVAGKAADDIGIQCGGWTIDWQGRGGPITKGTTILQAIRNTVSRSSQVTFSVDGTGAEGANVGVVVVGEMPYAEMRGDKEDLSLPAGDVAVARKVKDAGIPVVLILVSGRPLIIDSVLDQCDAVVAAWLPGTEGQGVADVLFGDYRPIGKLSFSWPRSMEQVPSRLGSSSYDPLFKLGHGLSY